MARKLQAWTIRYGAKMRRLVATDSKREAARLMGVSEYDFRQFGMNAGHDDSALAMKQPGVVFEREQTHRNESDWKVADAKPYEPRRVARHEPPVEDDCKCKRVGGWTGVHHPLCDKAPPREHAVRGRPMTALTLTVSARLPGADPAVVEEVLRVLDELGAGLIVPNREAPAQPNPAVAAIKYSMDAEESYEFLRCWLQGDFDACRREWPDSPEECYAGLEPSVQPVSKKEST